MSLNDRTKRFFKQLFRNLNPAEIGLDDIYELLEDAQSQGLLNLEKVQIIRRVLQHSEIRVADIMVPRQKAAFIDYEDSYEDIIKKVATSGHSRFPVAQGRDRDKIKGILMAKDLLRFGLTKDKKFNIDELLREAVMTPESKRLNVLLREFRKGHNHMALVVNEFGGIAGIVTLEDALEQIVGDIVDEHDVNTASPIITHTSDDSYLVPGSCKLDELEAEVPFEIERPADVETVNGLVVLLFGQVPKAGDYIEKGRLHVTVIESNQRNVSMVKIKESGS